MVFVGHRNCSRLQNFCGLRLAVPSGALRALALLALLACLFTGGQTVGEAQRVTPGRTSALPALGASRKFAPGVDLYTVQLPHNNTYTKLLVYLPAAPAPGPLPCIFIAPAGTPLFFGNAPGDSGNPPEYLPYVRAGYGVAVYEIDGDIPDGVKKTWTVVSRAAYAFRQAYAGVTNAQEAITYALARVPNIDPRRLYTAGHSSAGTLSLQAAAADSRIAACIAYAPCCDVEARLGAQTLADLTQRLPGFDAFMHNMAPINITTRLKCPTFVFHADDDTNVPLGDNAAFVAKLRQTNARVTFARVPTGNHYQSMIAQGIPQALVWLQKLAAPNAPAK